MKLLLEIDKNIAQVSYIKEHVPGRSKKTRIETYRENVKKFRSSRVGMPRTWNSADTLYLDENISPHL